MLYRNYIVGVLLLIYSVVYTLPLPIFRRKIDMSMSCHVRLCLCLSRISMHIYVYFYVCMLHSHTLESPLTANRQ